MFVRIEFKCINCQESVEEKMHHLHAKHVSVAGGCCEYCCKVAENYFSSENFKAFQDAEERDNYYV